MEVLTTILATIGGAGVLIVGLAAWLGNVWASRIRDSEKARSDREIEVLKASLEIQNPQKMQERIVITSLDKFGA
jgi:hypothetical protein